jgi:hypothetical protein
MTEAIIHIGLHKTGTTSFQIGCSQSAQLLRDHGILYPLDDLSTLGSNQHQGIVHRLMSGEDPIDEARRLFQLSGDASKLLLSAEDFSNFFGLGRSKSAAEAFSHELSNQFDKVTYYCVIREDRSIVISTIREMIDIYGIPLNGREWVMNEVSNFYERNIAVKRLLGTQLCALRYEDISKGILTKNLLKAFSDFDLEMPDTRAHVSSNKDFRYILMSNVRTLLYNSLKTETPYTKEVNNAYAKAFNSLSMEADMEKVLSLMFNSWLEDEVDHALRCLDCDLKKIYEIQPQPQRVI